MNRPVENISNRSTSPAHHVMMSEGNRRGLLILSVGGIAVVVLLGVAFSSLLDGEIRVAVIDTFAAAIISTILLFYKFSRFKTECCYIGVAMMYCLYAYLFFTGAADGNTYMWHYTFPFFATFLLGAKHGAIATLLLFIPVFIGVVFDAASPGEGYYTSGFAIRFIPSVSVALIFSYLFERERERSRRLAMKAYQEQEQIIEERTRQLQRETEDRERIAEKLRQSQKMEALGVMAGGVAHDLNNILAGIVSYPELIRLNLPKKSPLVEPLETMEKAGKRAAAVVDDLLTLARGAASVKETVNLNSLIQDFLASPEWQNIVASFKNVVITTRLEPELPAISCSQVHIRKCLMNLLHNGVEASAPSGEIIITTMIETDNDQNISAENKRVVLAIEDSGPGIGEEHLDHIFEPFYTTKKLGHSGSGLGLSVVWNTIEEHEGSISVTNSSQGACFTLRFPAVKSAPQPQNIKSLSLESLRGKGSILVIDDEPQLQQISSEIAKMLGYTVTVASSGEEGLSLFKENHYDLIVLDMLLGDGLSGCETYEKMLEIKPGQKAIIASGYSTSEEVEKTLLMGAQTIIKKPYSLEELGHAIKTCLQ